MSIRWIVCLALIAGVCLPSAAQSTQGAAPTAAQPAQAAAFADGDESAAQTQQDSQISPEEAVTEALSGILKGYRFNKRLLAQSRQDHWLLFTRGEGETALVGWTERGGSDEQRLALAPASPMVFGLYRYDGQLIRGVETVGYEIGMVLEREPKVLIPTGANSYQILAASAQTMPQVIRVKGPQRLELVCDFYNPLEEIAVMPVPDMGKTFAAQPGGLITVRKEVMVGRSSQPIETSIGAMGIRQPVTIVVENPLELVVRPEEPRVLSLDVINVGGDEINGEVLLSLGDSSEPFRLPLQFRSGQRLNTVRIPLSTPLPLPSTLSIAVEQTVAQPMRTQFRLGQTGPLQFVPAANFSDAGRDGALTTYRAETAGGASAIVRGGVPGNTQVPWPEYGALGLVYDLGPVTAEDSAQIDIVPAVEWAAQVVGEPGQIGFWLRGDGSGNLLSLVWTGPDGTEYVSEERAIDWRGWRYVMLKTPWQEGIGSGFRWNALLRLRGGSDTSAQARRGALLANGFCFVYGDNFSLSGYTDPAVAQYEQSVTMPEAPAVVSEPEIKLGEPMRRISPGGGRPR